MIIAVLLISLYTILYFWYQRKFFLFSFKVTTWWGLPFFGRALMFLNPNKFVDIVDGHLSDGTSPICAWFLQRIFVLTDLPQQMETVLTSPHCLDKGKSYAFIAESFGNGLIASKGNEWKHHRKILNSSFSYPIILQFVPIMNKHMRNFAEVVLEKLAGKGEFDILSTLQMSAMKLVCATTMDYKGEEANEGFLETGNILLEMTGKRCFQPWLQFEFFFKFSKHYRTYYDSQKKLFQTVSNMYKKKKEDYIANKSKTTTSEKEKDMGKGKSILIDRLLQLVMEEQTFTEQDVFNECSNFILAGFETTATSAANIMLLLATHPEKQEILFQELKTAFPKRRQDIPADILSNLPYLDCVVKEALRLMPSVPYLTRTAAKDIKIGDHTVPAGAELLLNVIGMHRKPQYWKYDPNAFNPENFLPENYLPTRHPYNYLPFSAGMRNCIGMKYANIALKFFTIWIVRDYRLTSTIRYEDIRFRMNVTLHLQNKHLVEVFKREE